MCLMCVEIAKKRMKTGEARIALRELIDTAKLKADLEHYQELNRLSDEQLEAKAVETAARMERAK